MLPLEARQHRAEPVVAGVALRADADDAAAIAGEPPDVVFGALDLAEHAPRRLEHATAGGGEHHPAPEPHEQRRAQPRLNVAQLMAQRRLRQVQPRRRRGHAAGIGDPGDEPQVANLQIHRRIVA